MTHHRFDDLMRDAAESYRRPPEPPLDQMWQAIERELATSTVEGESEPTASTWAHRGSRRMRFITRALPIAATLIIGVAIGRGTAGMGKASQPTDGPAPVPVASSARTDSGLSEPYQQATTKYLGQTAALLISLPSEVKAGRADQEFIGRAGDLLTTTRLLLDSPAAANGAMRSLLEDLELVLAQVVRLQNDRGRTELDLINEALEQRDVLPRLRTAVADVSAN